MKLVEVKDPYAWIEKKVHKILDRAFDDGVAILKKKDKEIVALVQNARNADELHYAPTQRILPYVQSWRKKQEVQEGRFSEPINGWFVVKKDTDELVSKSFETKEAAQKHLMTKMFANHHLFTIKKFGEVAEGEVVSARFGAKGPLKDSGIKVPPGYDRFKLDGHLIFGLRDGKWLKISSISDEKVGRELVKAYNQGGLTDSGLKPISLMQAFGSDELAALDSAGIKLTEKPANWSDFEEGGQSEEQNIHEVKLKKIEKTIGKLPVIDSADIYGGPLKPKGPMSSVRMMPDEQMFIIKFGDDTKYLVDKTGASTYIRFWQKIV